MHKVEGDYKIDNNKIVLSKMTSDYPDLLKSQLKGQTTLEFIIVSENEIYLNMENDLFCTIGGKKDGSFIKESK